ncbi:MAG: hypothetical protein HFF56_02765 [Lawsonibacter sp.]|nr:hypothetical protein [Lawsonibacter sp.]
MNKKQPPILELSYRTTMPVTQIRLFPSDGAYPVCPRCAISLDREYQRFCDRCGQRLGWQGYKKARIIHL